MMFIGNIGCDLCYYCEEESDSIYVFAKILKTTGSFSDGSGYTDDLEWNGNTATIYRDEGSGRIKIQEVSYNAYGFVTGSKSFITGSQYIIKRKDKWKSTSDSRFTSTYTWDGNIRKTHRSNGSLMYEEEYDDYARLIKQDYYSTSGALVREKTFGWDENYRYRGLYRTNSTYTGNYEYKATWDGNSNVYTSYSSSGSINWTSTSTVNEYDQYLIRTISDGTVYTREYGETFLPYK